MRQFKSQVYPPNGFNFTDSTGFVHQSDSWKSLEALVIDYRKRNNFPPGNPWEEIATQVCAGVPWLCSDSSPFVLMATNTWNQQVITWLGYIAGRKRAGFWPRVNDGEAARRAAICARCPLQKALVASCGACVNAVKNMRKALFDGQPPLHQNLSPCAYNGEDTQVTVHIQLEPNCDPALPAHCWRHPS